MWFQNKLKCTFKLSKLQVMDSLLDLGKTVILPLQQLPLFEMQFENSDDIINILDNQSYHEFRRLLGFMVNVMERYNITYMLSDKALLGSYLHHNMLPWDYHVDISVAYEDYRKLKRVR